MDFSDILASSIHDIKNSLGLILNSLDDLITNPDNHLADPRQASLLKHEVNRANSNLLQLLTLYKLGNAQLGLRIAEHNLDDFLDDVVADNQAVCTALGLELTYLCEEDLSGFFDWDLVRGLLNSIIGNAQRYARSRIRLSAREEDGYLVIRVEDDGAGFPESHLRMLKAAAEDSQEEGSEEGIASHTRLGLYFASRIAEQHRAGDRVGHIRLANAQDLPGGCFELWLP